MTTRWERLEGDTSRFAIRIAFASDPDEGVGAAPDVAGSWGSFQIWVEGRNLCAHAEQGERIDSVHWYLLPVLAWFAQNWNALLHEERLPMKRQSRSAWQSLEDTSQPPASLVDQDRELEWCRRWEGWWNRHCLWACREGGIFPDVVFRRFRDEIEVSWGAAQGAGTPEHFRFVESGPGISRLRPKEIAEPLHAMLTGACAYLQSLDEGSERLRALRKALRRLARSDQRQRRLGWLAGLGADEAGIRQGWSKAKGWLASYSNAQTALFADSARSPLVIEGSCQAALMFGCLEPTVGRDDVLALAEIVIGQHAGEPSSASLESVGGFMPVKEAGGQPWQQGYDLAEDLHEQLDGEFSKVGPVDIDAMLRRLKVDVIETSLSDDHVRGVSIAGPRHRPCIAWNVRHPFNARSWGKRFTLAHELCHLLFDWEEGRGLAIASGPWAPRAIEVRANAFAAMLLMPTELLRRVARELNAPLDTRWGIEGVASRLETGFRSTVSHLQNLDFIDEVVEERLLSLIPHPT